MTHSPFPPRQQTTRPFSRPPHHARRLRRLLPRSAQAFVDAAPGFGVEGTSAYGAGLARHLRRANCAVDRGAIRPESPDPARARGRSIPWTPKTAAWAVLFGRSVLPLPQGDKDHVGMIRTLRVARRSAVHSTRQIINQIHSPAGHRLPG